VDIILKLATNSLIQCNPDNVVMLVTHVEIIDPSWGFTAPIDNSVVYVQGSKPDRVPYEKHNDMTQDLYNNLVYGLSTCERQKRGLPILYSSCKIRREIAEEHKTKVTPDFPLNPPYPVGTWVLFKMLNAYQNMHENMDIQYFGMRGFLIDVTTGKVLPPPVQLNTYQSDEEDLDVDENENNAEDDMVDDNFDEYLLVADDNSDDGSASNENA